MTWAGFWLSGKVQVRFGSQFFSKVAVYGYGLVAWPLPVNET